MNKLATSQSPSAVGSCGVPKDNFTPRVESYGRVHCALGYDLSNVAMVAVDGGYVVIDTAATLESARVIRREFEKLAAGSPPDGHLHAFASGPYRRSRRVLRSRRADLGTSGFRRASWKSRNFFRQPILFAAPSNLGPLCHLSRWPPTRSGLLTA